MPKQYRMTAGRRVVNGVFATMTRLGLGASFRYLLTVRGRRTGRPYSTPVDVLEVNGSSWLVAGYGVVSWVHNVRASGEAVLSRGRESRRYTVEEAEPGEAVPVLRAYMERVPVTSSYFDVGPDAADEDVIAEVPRHPVFRLRPTAVT